jgi:methanethiol S-methyltransferase
MARALYLVFAVVAYAVAFASILYLIAFAGNLPFVPRTVDRGPAASLEAAVAINLALIALFGLQHSVMARPGFKRAWTRIVPPPIERSVYILAASAALILLYAFWRPIGGTVWSVEHPVGVALMWGLFALGWIILFVSTFLINHFELFGLQQAWLHARGRDAAAPEFREPLLYRQVRHPIYAGIFLGVWATPQMSFGHLLLAVGFSAYMLIAIRYEERDLIGLFGRQYEDYRGRVGMLVPRLRRRRAG